MAIDWIFVIATLIKVAFAIVFVMQIVPMMIWGERKVSAYIQDRPGPNRAYIAIPPWSKTPWVKIRAIGFVHTLVDVVKLIVKEDVIPEHVNKPYWRLAPVVAMTVALSTFVVIPWGDSLTIGETTVPLQVAGIDGGLLYVLAMTSLGVYGIMIAGWSSNNKFSLLGGLRSAAQMVSYELALGLSAIAMFVWYGTVRLDEIVAIQSEIHMVGGFLPLPNWGIFAGPMGVLGVLAFCLFWVAVFAECNRTPFDLPESDAELVAGYHLEYSSLRFALFFMAEYANMIVASAVTATIFFGGYSVPYLSGEALRAHSDVVLMVLGLGGAATFAALTVLATKRKNSEFNVALRKQNPNDPRTREWIVFTAVWAAGVVASLAFVGLGAAGMVSSTAIGPEILTALVHVNMLIIKVLVGGFMFIWVRWTVPRFRYDQLMNLGWKLMLPIAVANVFLMAVWIAVTQSTV